MNMTVTKYMLVSIITVSLHLGIYKMSQEIIPHEVRSLLGKWQ